MSISPIIANMSLDGLQKVIFDLHPDQFNIDYSNGNFIRYADDIFVTSRTKEFAIKIKSAIEKFLSVRGMKLSEKKTRIIHVSQGFNFLSRYYCKRDGIFCVTPSDKAVKVFEDNLKDFILNKGKQISQRNLIKGINAKLHGWAAYHRVEQSYDVFRHIDCIVSSLLLKLMKEIFPSKSRKQIIETYWYEEADGSKSYSLPQRRDIKVIKMKNIILINHEKVVLNKNPYIDKEYFELRMKDQDIQKVNGDLKSIWRRQKGRCFYCGRKLFEDQQKRLIHINSLDDDSIENLAYIHETCSQKEAEFIETDIENPNETDVFEIIDETSENKVDYSKLKKYFSKRKERKFSLTFSKIEKILDQYLSQNAYKSKAFWFRKRSNISSAWQSMGFEIFSVDLRKQKVFFHKSKKVSKLSIPEIFLTDKIPNDAKYELEQFFKYIRKKYGI